MATIAEQIVTLNNNLDAINTEIGEQEGLISDILIAIDTLPNGGGGGAILPTLNNPGTANHALKDKQFIGSDGNIITGAIETKTSDNVSISLNTDYKMGIVEVGGYYPDATIKTFELSDFYDEAYNKGADDAIPDLTNPATSADVLFNKEFIDGSGNVVEGAIITHSTLEATNSTPGQFTINGELMVSVSGGSNSTGYVDQPRLNISTPARAFGDATSDQVLAGAKFTSSEGVNIEGAIESKGIDQINVEFSAEEVTATAVVPSGYYEEDIQKTFNADSIYDVGYEEGYQQGLAEGGNSPSGRITNLTGTTWKLNSGTIREAVAVPSNSYYSINFTSNGEDFINIRSHDGQVLVDSGYPDYPFIGYGKDMYSWTEVYSGNTVLSGTWKHYNYRIIEITGGNDVTNENLINVLYNIGNPISSGGGAESSEVLAALCDWSTMVDSNSAMLITIRNSHPTYNMACELYLYRYDSETKEYHLISSYDLEIPSDDEIVWNCYEEEGVSATNSLANIDNIRWIVE